jgi:hypothetical protein
MEPIKEPAAPKLEETQPVQLKQPRVKPWLRWTMFAFSCLVFLAVVVVLALPSLARPPAVGTEPYDFFSLSDSSELLDPAVDHLVESADGRVAVYIPQGANLGPGQFLILERRPEFIPFRVEGSAERLNAVDLIILRPDGELDGNPVFQESILLCFFLLDEQVEDLKDGSASFVVQNYIESIGGAAWSELEASPGWQEGQVCSALKHLSLYALTRIGAEGETPIPASTPEDALPKELPLLELYGFPSPTP